MGLRSDTRERNEAIRDGIAQATVAAFEADEPMTIRACMAPCVSPPRPYTDGCPLCEVLIVYPNGTVFRETRNH